MQEQKKQSCSETIEEEITYQSDGRTTGHDNANSISKYYAVFVRSILNFISNHIEILFKMGSTAQH